MIKGKLMVRKWDTKKEGGEKNLASIVGKKERITIKKFINEFKIKRQKYKQRGGGIYEIQTKIDWAHGHCYLSTLWTLATVRANSAIWFIFLIQF